MRLRILLVDDNAHFLTAASELLVRQGVEIVGVASTAIDAQRLARELRPDGVLVDVDLGAESGFTLAELLAHDAFAVVLISAYSEAEFSDLLATSPAVGFIPKAELSGDRVSQAFDGRSAGDA